MIGSTNVVLPTPLRPITTSVSPGKMSRSSPCSTRAAPYPALTPRRDISGDFMPVASSVSKVGLSHAVVAADLVRRATRQHGAAGEDRNPVSKAEDEVHVVLDEQHRGSFSQGRHLLEQRVALRRRQAGGGLVQQQYARLERIGQHHLQHTLLAVRQ